jgi:hypothetical protein
MITRDELRARLRIPHDRLDAINDLLLDPHSRVVNDLLNVVARYGAPEEINRQAEEARNLDNLLFRLAEHNCRYLDDIEWLIAQRGAGAFISEADYRQKVLGPRAGAMTFRDDFAVTLEISGAQYFPWLI